VIEFEAGNGTPHGWISVDGGQQWAFYGWMDLTAHLESVTGGSSSPRDPDTRVERSV
jgi:hypothetical protein